MNDEELLATLRGMSFAEFKQFVLLSGHVLTWLGVRSGKTKLNQELRIRLGLAIERLAASKERK